MARKILKLAYILSYFLFPLLVMLLAGQRLANIPLRLAVFGLISLGGAWLFRKGWPQYGWGSALLLTTLGYAVTYKLSSFIPDISTYPFSLGWSETSRYYYASLWLSEKVYGIKVPPSILHPSRYLLQSIPFLFDQSSLVIHRAWQVVLWIVTASLTSWLLVKRLSLSKNNRPTVVIVCTFFWAFIFLFQGPVYYHLLVMVILILWGFDATRFWRNLVLVLLASLWAGISRVNWLPVPGLLAAALYLLEARVGDKPMWRYLLPPAVYVLAGTGVAYLSQQAYQLLSGNPPAWFGSSFTSDLLWYRLLPNPTFPLGILPSAIFVSLPLVCLMILRLTSHLREYRFIRILALVAILFVLFAGGVIVSVKIGGGSNLHNLDAYLALLLVISSYIYFDRFQPDKPAVNIDHAQISESPVTGRHYMRLETIFVAAALIFPLYFALGTGGAIQQRDFSAALDALQTIKSVSQQAVKEGGEVLFINQRHLLTFNTIQDVPLVAENELVFLMEMAMSGNPSYLDAFHLDLAGQRYSVIVSEPLTTNYQGRSHSFGEENDAWVENVSEPVLCYYQPAVSLDAVGIVVYTPRETACK